MVVVSAPELGLNFLYKHVCSQAAKLISKTHELGCKTTLRELACFWIQLFICTGSQDAQCKEIHLGQHTSFALNEQLHQLLDSWEIQKTEIFTEGWKLPFVSCQQVQ